ncbi:breast carcinoma-amplified sequence 1 isoform X3 [Dunckerocampus dactyliophorus]|uniref:breast carcinoma-amplified sequence 1 isoform X3 n=1 Tax=Dunckerocampus dactyliophorus TaxID=161453 RepID=UPI002404F032|nr:breast carcinoma-amplified sequence 1 isoform X3 [Dunckerocampus dactyliophorus]
MGNEHSKSKDPSKDEKNHPSHENGGVNGLTVNITSNELDIDINRDTTVQPNGKAAAAEPLQEHDLVMVSSEGQPVEALPASPEAEQPKDEKVHLFDKLFKKKAEPEATVNAENVDEEERQNDEIDISHPDAHTELEPANLQPETLTELPTQQVASEQTDKANGPAAQTEETNPEESPVMNFFKNLMSPSKTSKKETAEVPKDQRQKENQPAPSTTVVQVSDPPAAAKGMLIPPPPPPEPPKPDVKAELSGKPAKASTSKEKPKAATAKDGKSSKDVLGKFFRTKTNKETPLQDVEVETVVEIQTNMETPLQDGEVETVVEIQEAAVEAPQAVVEVETDGQQTAEEATRVLVEEKKVDPSKAATLEATAKPEATAPVHQEKKTPPKSSIFSFFKPKAGDPKKASPAPATAAPPTAKAKEEPKAAAKSPEPVVDDKAASAPSKSGDGGANQARKTEKRNSIQLFLKHLGQKRHSTDAGVQTEPVIVAAAAEKSK